MKIIAGQPNDIHWESGFWVFLDIGFSNQAKSCGLLMHDSQPTMHRYSDAVSEIIEVVKIHDRINLVIEAPLSVSFDKLGNPTGRKIEKDKNGTRYWYMGPGNAVMVAAFYLLYDLVNSKLKSDIRLFEGFVSYKDKNSKSDHARDVLLLREVIKTPEKYSQCIYSPESLLMNREDKLSSAFNMDFGIPLVIKRDG